MYETKTDSTDLKNRFVLAKEQGGEGKKGSLGLAEANYYI